MNKLSIFKQSSVIRALVEGNSIRSTERMTGIHRDTIMRLTSQIGDACEVLMDRTMVNLPCKQIQVDEIWSYVGKKQRHVTTKDDLSQVGDIWTWVAMDADSKAIPAYYVGKRDVLAANAFIADVAGRMKNRIQISSDALKAYVDAIDASFGGDVDYAQIVKTYEAEPAGSGRYSPPKVTSVAKFPIFGNPKWSKVSTSYVERQNLTIRMSMRRFTRLTNAFSKKVENLKSAIALHFAHYNFIRVHSSLRCTPAMALGIVSKFWEIEDLVEMAN